MILSRASGEAAQAKGKEPAENILGPPHFRGGERLGVGAAFGVAAFRLGENAGEALEAADRAMFFNKKASSETREE